MRRRSSGTTLNDAVAHAAGGKPFTLTVIRPS